MMEVISVIAIFVFYRVAVIGLDALGRIHETLRNIEHHVRRIPADPADRAWD